MVRRAGLHTIEVIETEAITARSADVFAAGIRAAIELRGSCILALSGGSTPAAVFAELATRDLPWEHVIITQVDERIAPAGHSDRNLTGQQSAFADLPVRWIPLGVEGPDLDETLAALTAVAGVPLILDVVHLGLGSDGHTASLVPGDPVLDNDDDIAITDEYQGRQRMTFTKPSLDRARLVVWLVVGADKAPALAKLASGDKSIPAALLAPPNSLILADTAAAADLPV